MQKKLFLFFVLSLIGCQQQNIFDIYRQQAIKECGSYEYYDVDKSNVIERYNCLTNLQNRILLPNSPYPDINVKTMNYMGLLVEKFHNNEITKQEFLTYRSQAQSNAIAEGRNREIQDISSQQPITLPQIPLNTYNQTRSSFHCTTYHLGQFGQMDCN